MALFRQQVTGSNQTSWVITPSVQNLFLRILNIRRRALEGVESTRAQRFSKTCRLSEFATMNRQSSSHLVRRKKEGDPRMPERFKRIAVYVIVILVAASVGCSSSTQEAKTSEPPV